MAYDFPTSPTDGQVSGAYYWSASKGAWRVTPTTVAKTIPSPTAPTSAVEGDQWLNTNDGSLFIRWNDGSSTQWVESRAPITADGYTSPNYVINGGFDIWQRGTATVSGIANATFHPDRWIAITDSVGTVNSSRVDVSAQGIGSQYGWRLERTAGTNRWVAIQIAEGALSMVGKTVTLSAYIRKGSALTSNITLDLSTRASKFGTGYDYTNATFLNSALSSSTFTRVSVSLPITAVTATNGADLFEIEIAASQAGAANAYFEVAGVQLELGTVPTAFRRNANSIQGELAACQRYYQRYIGGAGCGFFGAANSATGILGSFNLPVVMRAIPGATASGSIWVSDQYLTDQQATSASVAAQQGYNTNGGRIVLTGFSGLTTGRWYSAPAAAIGSGYIDFNAEL